MPDTRDSPVKDIMKFLKRNLFFPFLHFDDPMLIHTKTADPHIDLLRIQIVGCAVVCKHIHNIADCISPHVT